MTSAPLSPPITLVRVVILGLGMVACEGSTNPTADGAPPCPWEGWYVSPWSDCEQLCLPDNPERRVRPLRWVGAEDICPSCTKLEMPTPSDILWDFYAVGHPDYLTVAYDIPVEGEREL